MRESGPDGAPPPSADRDAIASGASVPAPAIAAHVSFPARAVSSRALRLRPEADAPGLIRAILRHALDYRELCLKSPLVRPSMSTSGLSLSDCQRRRGVDRAGRLAEPANPRGGQGHGCACRDVAVACPGRLRTPALPPCSDHVVAVCALSYTCMPTALQLLQRACVALCPSVPLHARAYACVVSTLGWPAGGLGPCENYAASAEHMYKFLLYVPVASR